MENAVVQITILESGPGNAEARVVVACFWGVAEDDFCFGQSPSEGLLGDAARDFVSRLAVFDAPMAAIVGGGIHDDAAELAFFDV